MKIHIQGGERKFTPETAIDRATLDFPELTFESHNVATRILNRSSVTLTIRHNSTAIFRCGVHSLGFIDGDNQFDRAVEALTEELLKRAAPDLAAWRLANPAPTPKAISADSIKFGAGDETASS